MRRTLTDTKRCYNHTHRTTDLVCDRCRTSYCDECLIDQPDGRRLCSLCIQEVAAAEALKPTWRSRLRGFVISTRNLLIGLAIAAVIIAGLLYAFKDSFNRPITPEELARFRYAMQGSFTTEEGLNLNSTVLDARIVSATSEDPESPARKLIDEYYLGGVPAWRSTSAALPQEIVVQWGDKGSPGKVILVNHPEEDIFTYVKEFEVLISATGPDSGFQSVGKFRMAQNADVQRFEFTPVVGQWVMLRVLSNYGSQSYTSLAEFDVYVIVKDPFGSPTRTPGAAPAATAAPPAK